VDEAHLIDRQVDEGNELAGVVVDEGDEADRVGAHAVAEVVQAHLPADQVLDVLHDNVGSMDVGGGVGRRRR